MRSAETERRPLQCGGHRHRQECHTEVVTASAVAEVAANGVAARVEKFGVSQRHLTEGDGALRAARRVYCLGDGLGRPVQRPPVIALASHGPEVAG